MGNLDAALKVLNVSSPLAPAEVVSAAFRAYHGEPDKPRMMYANPDYPVLYHSGKHEWSAECDVYPKCQPVDPPAPERKLEAGCTVRHKQYVTGTGYNAETGSYDEAEIISVGKKTALTTHGEFRLEEIEVTAPATPEIGDYVRAKVVNLLGVVDYFYQFTDGKVDIRCADGSTHRLPRWDITIIAKARHAQEMTEGG